MKKPYQKPYLYQESFMMSTHIASGCNVGSATVTYNESTATCSYTDKNLVLHMDQNTCYSPFYIESIDGKFSDYISRLQGGGYDCYNAFSSGGAFSS